MNETLDEQIRTRRNHPNQKQELSRKTPKFFQNDNPPRHQLRQGNQKAQG